MITAIQAAADKKAIDPLMLDLRPIANFTDFFLITSGANIRQVQAIADEIVERLKRSGNAAQRVEGYAGGEWVLVDYGDFVVHIFEDKARHFYDLERLWREAARVELKPEYLNDDRGFTRDES
ncbi:MAG: ribosome silencing factor [Pyrinomonadaceae bacterium]|nr:ribosome silencing factor [Pyrinomonadaceae bacterium]